MLRKVGKRHFFFQFLIFLKNISVISNAQVSSNIGKRQLPGNSAKNLLEKKSFTTCKPQVQGASLSTSGVDRRKLGFKYQS